MQINGTDGKKNVMELHISYHNGDHYNSVRRLGDCTSGPACIKLTTTTIPVAAAAMSKAAIKVLDEEEEEDNEEEEDEDTRDDSFEAHHHLPSISSGQEGLSRVERELMDQTGCEDLAMVRKYLCAHDYEVREAADALINYIVHQHKGKTCVQRLPPRRTRLLKLFLLLLYHFYVLFSPVFFSFSSWSFSPPCLFFPISSCF